MLGVMSPFAVSVGKVQRRLTSVKAKMPIDVMYMGKIMESGDLATIFKPPAHPYTRALLPAVPIADPERPTERHVLRGEPPDPANPPAGCKFATRRPEAAPACRQGDPPLVEIGDGHCIRCHLS